MNWNISLSLRSYSFLSLLISPKIISIFFDIYLSEVSSYSATSKKTYETVLIAFKVYSVFHEIFKIYTSIKNRFYKLCKGDIKKKKGKKGTILTLGEGVLLSEMVRSYLCFYGKTWNEHNERKNKSLKRKKRNSSNTLPDNTF